MNQQIFVAIGIIALVLLSVLFTRKVVRREVTRHSPQTALAFSFIIAGIVFGEDRILGYSLMGIGVVLAILDAIGQMKLHKDKG